MSNRVCEAGSGRIIGCLAVLIPLIVYLAVGVPCAYLSLERLNSDGVCYLHRAILLSQGDVGDSITAYWSPLLIWSTVPLLKLGVDPLHAIRWTLFAWGMVYVLTTMAFLRTVLPTKFVWRIIAGAAVALAAVRLSVPTITPDVLLGAILMGYFALTARPALPPARALAAGAVGGFAYLAKAYALPFFIAHFLVCLFWRKDRTKTALAGFAGFAMVAGPWLTVLSLHYGRPTFSTATTRNRFMGDVAPPDVAAHPPDVSRLPPGPFISNMEVTDADAWPSWSPFDSSAHFAHQCWVVWDHLTKLIADVWRFDYLGITLIAIVVALYLWQRIDFTAKMLLTAGIIYGGGLLFVAYETRYVLPVLLPIGMAVCFLSLMQVPQKWRCAGTVAASAYLIAATISGWPALTEGRPRITYREMAQTLRDAGLNQTFASNTSNRDRAACLAFFLDRKFIALPQDRVAVTLQTKLDAVGVHLFTDWYDPAYANSNEWPEPQARLLLTSGNWKRQLAIHLDSKRRLDVYRRMPQVQ